MELLETKEAKQTKDGEEAIGTSWDAHLSLHFPCLKLLHFIIANRVFSKAGDWLGSKMDEIFIATYRTYYM